MTTAVNEQRRARGRAAARRACGRWLRSLRRCRPSRRTTPGPTSRAARTARRRGTPRPTPARLLPTRRERERPQRKFVFGREPQRRTARHDDSQHGAALSQRRHFGCDSDDLLEVVQKQQGGPVADQGDDAVEERSFLGLLDVECGRERREERRRLGDVCKRDERESVRELCCEQPSELDQHARLSDPAGTGDRDHPLRSHEIGERGELACAPNERHRRSGETARQAREALALSLERSRVRYHQAVGRHGKEFEARPTFLSLNRPSGTATTSLRFLICSYAASDSKTPPGTANDSIRAATLTASPVNRSGSTTTSPLCTPIRTSTSCGASSC